MQLWDVATRRSIGAPLVVQRDAFVAAVMGRDGSHLYALPTGTEGMRLRSSRASGAISRARSPAAS